MPHSGIGERQVECASDQGNHWQNLPVITLIRVCHTAACANCSLWQSEQFVASWSSTSDARYIGFRSLQETTQPEAEDQLVPVLSLRIFPTLTSPREDVQEDRQSLQETLRWNYISMGIWILRKGLQTRICSTSLVSRLGNAGVLVRTMISSRWMAMARSSLCMKSLAESFTPHLEYPPESRHAVYLQNTDQLYQHSFDESFTAEEGHLYSCGHRDVVQYDHEGISATSCQQSQHMQYCPLVTPLQVEDRVRAYLPESWNFG